jgi:hypothetical protein
LIVKTLIWQLNGKYSSHLSNITSLLISKSNDDVLKYEKAKKWNISIVNGVWLSELYLGNTLALNKPIEERYTNLNVNHFSFDNQFVLEFLESWKSLIRLPIEKIKVRIFNWVNEIGKDLEIKIHGESIHNLTHLK